MNWHDPEQSLYWGSLSIALVYLHNRPRERQRSGACFLRIKAEVQAIKQRAADWLTTCLGDWDAQTHMSKTEWQKTCQRVSKEREQFLLNTPGAMSIGTKAVR